MIKTNQSIVCVLCLMTIHLIFVGFVLGLSLSMLQKDYYSLKKEVFPYRKFGYFNPIDFAKSLTDILQIQFVNNQLMFYAIADKSTEHILKMVGKQKKPKMYNQLKCGTTHNHLKRKFRVNSQWKDLEPCHPPALVRSSIHKLVKKNIGGVSLSNVPQLYKEINGFELSDNEVKHLPNYILQMPDIASLEFGRVDAHGNNLYLYPSKKVVQYTNLIENKVRLDQTTLHLSENSALQTKNSTDVPVVTGQSTDTTVAICTSAMSTSFSTKNSSSVARSHTQLTSDPLQPSAKGSPKSSSPVLTSAPKSPKNSTTSHVKANMVINEVFQSEDPPLCRHLQEQIVQILNEHQMGLWARRLPEMYKKKFKIELDLLKLGYNSIIEFVSTMSDKVSICRPQQTSDWMLSLRKEDSKNQHGMFGLHVPKSCHIVLFGFYHCTVVDYMPFLFGGIISIYILNPTWAVQSCMNYVAACSCAVIIEIYKLLELFLFKLRFCSRYLSIR